MDKQKVIMEVIKEALEEAWEAGEEDGMGRNPGYNTEQGSEVLYNRIADCGGTGKCQHKGKWAYASADNDNQLPRCLDCQQEVERRSGAKRRESGEYITKPGIESWLKDRSNKARRIYYTYHAWRFSRRILDDRRRV